MYIETVPNHGSRPTVLLREGWREDGKIKKRTIANLTDWPESVSEKLTLRGGERKQRHEARQVPERLDREAVPTNRSPVARTKDWWPTCQTRPSGYLERDSLLGAYRMRVATTAA
jgi:hypothetical protein